MQTKSTGRKQDIELQKRIIFALDVSSAFEAQKWVDRLQDRVKFFKVGWELFLAAGFDMVHWIAHQGCEVMLDLKFFDVPRTVEHAMAQLKDKPISLSTVHGNSAILQAAQKAGAQTKILAVTVLTSLDQEDLAGMGLKCRPQDLVLFRAAQALEAGCAGVVCSGLELPLLRKKLGREFLAVVPGVRPQARPEQDDQKRTVTVQQAFAQGADHVVLGRPVREAADALDLLRRLQEDILEDFTKRVDNP